MKVLNKKLIIIVSLLALILLASFVWVQYFSQRVDDIPPATSITTQNGISDEPYGITSVATDLRIPWSLDFLPDGSIIFTERPGRVRLIDADGGLIDEPLKIIEDVAHDGEGGLLGIAVHPDFINNSYVYVYYTYIDGGSKWNKVVRFKKEDTRIVEDIIIIDGIPGSFVHNGGRIKFGPDGYLYITTGDAADKQRAQDLDFFGGKILRLTDDGDIPLDNPFPGSAVYSFGHRNPQGLAWDDGGRLWATEHGSSATDELNLIEPGKNYGWPIIRGDEISEGLVIPVVHSGSNTWAPSGMAYLNGSLFFAGLRGQSLYEVVVDEDPVVVNRHFNRNFGRMRDVAIGPDGFLYVLTSNRDGRGVPASEDDQIIRIDPEVL